MYELVNYSNYNGFTSYFKLVYINNDSGSGNRNNIERLDESCSHDHDEVERCSLSRTKRNIKELALCNDFEYFATFTINSKNCDRFSLQEVQDNLRKLFKRFKRVNKNFGYLIITEKHKNGAFHFHGLIKGIDVKIKNKKFSYELYINNNGYLSHSLFDLLGFNSFSKIHDYNKTCNYIMKYITKDCVRNESGRIYIRSKGLIKATREEINPIDLSKFVTKSHSLYTNDFCSVIEFSADDLNEEQKLYFINNVKNRLNFRNNIDLNYLI